MTTPDIDALKNKLKATWMDADYDTFSRYMEGPAREFYGRIGVKPGQHMFDVACGAGGPTTRAFATLDAATGATLRDELVALWTANNQSTDPNRTTVDGEYLQVLARA